MNRRRNQAPEKPKLESKFYIYIAFLFIFGLLALFLFIFGVDFGFFSREGTNNTFVLIGFIAIGFLVEYYSDIKYINSIFTFVKKSPSPLRFIPIIGILTIFYPIYKKIGYALLGVGILCVLIATTPLIFILGERFLIEGPTTLAAVAFLCFSGFLVLRGVATVKMKEKLVKLHNDLGGEGASGTTFLRGLFYFLPIGRTMSMLQDANFISTVDLMKQDSQKQDEGEY